MWPVKLWTSCPPFLDSSCSVNGIRSRVPSADISRREKSKPLTGACCDRPGQRLAWVLITTSPCCWDVNGRAARRCSYLYTHTKYVEVFLQLSIIALVGQGWRLSAAPRKSMGNVRWTLLFVKKYWLINTGVLSAQSYSGADDTKQKEVNEHTKVNRHDFKARCILNQVA